MYQQGYRPPAPAPRRTANTAAGARPPAARKASPKGGAAPRRPGIAAAPRAKRKSGILRVLLLLAALAGLCYGAFYTKNWLEVRPYDNLFAPNVYVDGIALGGMTAQQGVDAVRASAQSRADSFVIRLVAQGYVYAQIDSSLLGITYDTNTALNAAWAIGHRGTVFDRNREMSAVRAQGYYAYSASPGANTQPIDELLSRLKDDVYRAPQNASVTFVPQASNPFSFTQEVEGMVLDTQGLKDQIYQKVANMESGDVEIVPTRIQPEITVADLQSTVALRYTATTPIDPKSEQNRTNNIRRAFELINGTVLKPGEKFSFNNVVGWREVENGFFPAPEYAYGELETGIGGGVCQASTTVYLAAISSGLKITARSPHSDPVSYTPFGKDATVYMSKNRKIDFAFQNNTEGNLYITAAVKTDPANRKRLISEVSIYGLSMGDVRYELVARETRVIPAPDVPEYIKDKQNKYNLAPGQEKSVMKARDGHVVVSELIKRVGGIEVERFPVDEDTYKARAARIYVGVER